MARTTNQSDTGADRQWDLMRASFDGDWQGVTTWYGRDSTGMNVTRGESDPAGSLYAIRFPMTTRGFGMERACDSLQVGNASFPCFGIAII
jgi:hypothetical protein